MFPAPPFPTDQRPLPARQSVAWLAEFLAGIISAEQGRFVLWLPVALGAGVLLYGAWPSEPPIWAGAALALAAAAALVLWWRADALRWLLLLVLATGLGVASSQFATWRAPPLAVLPTRAVILAGQVRAVDVLPSGRRITLGAAVLAPGAAPQPRLLRVRLRDDDALAPMVGDTLRIRAILRPPPPPAYPGAWDLQRADFYSGLGGSGFALGPAELLARAPPHGLALAWQGFREAIARRVQAILPGARGAIAATVLTGLASSIPPPDRAAFADSGLAHLLAVAGLHIGIVMGFVFLLLRAGLAASPHAALHWPCKQIAGVGALVAALFYLALTGAHVPILRSFAMASLVTLALLAGRRALSLRALALAAALLLLASPQEIWGVSFQMSFSAVLALIAGYDALRPQLAMLRGRGTRARRLGWHLATLALTSLLAGNASAPFAANQFGHFQLYFVLANLVAVPITAFWVMPAGLIGLLLLPFGLGALALVPMGWGIAALLWIARHVSALPAATLPVPPFPDWGILLVAFGMAWLGLWRSRLRLFGLLPLLLGLASPLATQPTDILVAADARLLALHSDGAVFAERRPGASAFTVRAISQYWVAPILPPLPENGVAGGWSCTPQACRLGGAWLLRDPAAHPDCTGATLLVSLLPLRGLCPGLPRVDRETLWQNGAVAIWLQNGQTRILTDRALRGARPWVPPVPDTTSRSQVGLPMAPIERLRE